MFILQTLLHLHFSKNFLWGVVNCGSRYEPLPTTSSCQHPYAGQLADKGSKVLLRGALSSSTLLPILNDPCFSCVKMLINVSAHLKQSWKLSIFPLVEDSRTRLVFLSGSKLFHVTILSESVVPRTQR